MKIPYLALFPVLFSTSVNADVLTNLNSFFGSSRPDYDSASLEPTTAAGNPGYAPFSPADSDLGVQQVLGTYTGPPPVNVTFNTSVNYTNNAPGQTAFDDDSAWFSASRLAASWRPKIAYGWFADLGLSQDALLFEGNKAVDFENFQPYAGLVKSLPDLDDLVIFTRYEYQRITTGSISESSYCAQRIRTGIQKDLILTSRYQLSAGLDAALDLEADAESQQRNTYSADVSFTYWFADHLSATASYTAAQWDFKDGGREDWDHILGVELTWTPCENLSIFANLVYSNHESNSAFGANDFEAWQSGIGLGLNYSF
jgi:hypothetical protein